MYRGYELLTWESRLAGVEACRMGKFHQMELKIRLRRIMENIILQAVAVWNWTLAWINPNLELDAEEDGFDDPWGQESGENKISGKILDLGQRRAGKASGGGNGHLEQQGGLAERLLDTYGNSILRLAYSYLHNYSDAEDILQETLIRYLQNIPKVAGPVHEKAWLLKVAANLSKNRIDYNRLRDTDELNEELIVEEREDLSFVWEAVKALPEKYREAIHLYYYEGYSTGQMAVLLGRKESSVRSDLKRGREKLKMILKEAYDFE